MTLLQVSIGSHTHAICSQEIRLAVTPSLHIHGAQLAVQRPTCARGARLHRLLSATRYSYAYVPKGTL